MQLQRINFIASFPKSGSTWSRLMLGAYRHGSNNINVNSEMTLSDTQFYAYNAVAPIPVADMEDGAILYLRNAALMHIAARAMHLPIILKTHHANIEVGEVHLIPSDMTEGAVYLVRDPRDVVISYAEHIGKTIDETIESMNCMGHSLVNKDHNVNHYVTTWSNHVKGWRDHGDFKRAIIRYEDMLDDPKLALTKILTTFNMPISERKLDLAIELTTFDECKRQERRAGFIEASQNTEFFKRGTKGHWQDILTDKQVKQIEIDHGEMMVELGYDLVTKAAAA